MSFTLRFADTVDNWNKALNMIMANSSYRKFISATSPFKPVVVENRVIAGVASDEFDWHENCQNAELAGIGAQLSGWYLMCDFIYKEFPKGMCRMSHHSNLQLKNGEIVNPTVDSGRTHHIFLRDDIRREHIQNGRKISYNERMWYSKAFQDTPSSHPPKNTVIYVADDDNYAYDSYFETYTYYSNPRDAYAACPFPIHDDRARQYVSMKSNWRKHPPDKFTIFKPTSSTSEESKTESDS